MKIALLLMMMMMMMVVKGEELYYKQLGGPPSEFEAQQLPEANAVLASETSALLVETLATSEGPGETTVELPVDSEQLFRLTLASPLLGELSVAVLTPLGDEFALGAPLVEDWPLGDSGSSNAVPVWTWSVRQPAPGLWRLRVSWAQPLSPAATQLAVLLYNDNADVTLDVQLLNYASLTERRCGLVAWLAGRRSVAAAEDDALIDRARIDRAVVRFTLPDGSLVQRPMLDDGSDDDRWAHDGRWTGSMVARLQHGTYNAAALVYGRTGNGLPFVRSVQLPFSVVADHTQLLGTAALSGLRPGGRLQLAVDVDRPSSGTKFRVYAEVWGTALAGSGDAVPLAWSAALGTTATLSDGRHVVYLEVDIDWLALARAAAPLQLRRVSLQCANTGVVVAQLDSVAVSLPDVQLAAKLAVLAANRTVAAISERMTLGLRPAHLQRSTDAAAALPTVLVHGYCAGDNPWRRDNAVWTQPHYFQDYNANRGNDQFAVLINQFVAKQGIGKDQAWAGVGHSQGGMALTHLLNYYWTGLDVARPGRPVQSLGTPYQGCSIAGSSANLGAVFGVGCGAQPDLTPNGAALWLPGITAASRAKVYFYTTTYKQGTLTGDYCSLAVNSVLKWPNDGTAEQVYARLPGANNCGETQKQCHTSSMKYAPQYHDTNRNRQINTCAQSKC